MSQIGGCIDTDHVAPGTSWALIAHSAIGGAGGILAASSDIELIILAGDISSLFVFPGDSQDPGLYLWMGSLKHEPELQCITAHCERLHPDYMQTWIDNNGAQP